MMSFFKIQIQVCFYCRLNESLVSFSALTLLAD